MMGAMCGRYMITSPFEAMIDLFEAEAADGLGPWAARPNVSPTETVPVVVGHEDGRSLVAMRWGFLPHWYKTPNDGPLLINARAETIAEKPAFRAAARERRCLIPADGFYEWKGEKGAKVPFVIRSRAGGMIAFAGVWQEWGPAEARLPTCAIVTCAANATCAEVHDRMPVVVAREDWPLWLGEAGKGAVALMRPAPEDALVVNEADAATRAVLRRRPGGGSSA
jgi:putative SOS response-associated peptidase YedK